MNKHISLIDADSWQRALRFGADQLEIHVSDAQIDQLRSFADELLIANQAVNLTSITDPLEIAEKLMLDSMMPGRFIPPGSSVLDLGTGGGFPGIPLKICFPALSLTLLDSKRKKINFVKYSIRMLNLTGIGAIQARAEELAGNPEMARSFDVVVSRAVTSLSRLNSLAISFLKKNGIIIAMRGAEALHEADVKKNETANQTIDGDELKKNEIQVFPYQLPISGKERNLIVIRLSGTA
jgi:16S rRNA (guanine527-N7)-methyltransferase